MEREAGAGSGWETHVNPWLIHVNVWQKPLKNCKLISLQLIKIIGGKRGKLSSEKITDVLARVSYCLLCGFFNAGQMLSPHVVCISSLFLISE